MQMQQQLDCNASKAVKGESFGCASDLYTWVETTVGAGAERRCAAVDLRPDRERRRLDLDGLL